ncbi:MAG: GerMN domain-containing protein [Candidatus Aminicenantia bacterium]
MKKGKLIILGILFVIVIFLLVFIFLSQRGEKIKEIKEEIYLSEEPLYTEEEEKMKVTLFFIGEKDSLLHSEEREIYLTPSLINQAKQVIIELIKGSTNDYISPLPPDTRLRELFLTKEGIVYVDFSKEIYQQHPGGSQAEITAIYAVVNSLAYNFKQIKKVQILIEGMEKETLNGHIDLTKPFSPRFSLITK